MEKLNPPIRFSFLYDDDWHVIEVREIEKPDGKYPLKFSESENCFENWISCGDEKIEYEVTDIGEDPDWWAALDEGWSWWLRDHPEQAK